VGSSKLMMGACESNARASSSRLAGGDGVCAAGQHGVSRPSGRPASQRSSPTRASASISSSSVHPGHVDGPFGGMLRRGRAIDTDDDSYRQVRSFRRVPQV
jgi:hypothetical protein